MSDEDCTDDENPEEIPAYEPGELRPTEVDPFTYLQTGALNVGFAADGLPQILGHAPEGPEPGLDDDNLICEAADGRPRCVHLCGIITDAPGVAKGFAPLRQVRRFCKKMSTTSELFDLAGTAVYACLTREPQDECSIREWSVFETRQKQAAREAAETRGEMEW